MRAEIAWSLVRARKSALARVKRANRASQNLQEPSRVEQKLRGGNNRRRDYDKSSSSSFIATGNQLAGRKFRRSLREQWLAAASFPPPLESQVIDFFRQLVSVTRGEEEEGEGEEMKIPRSAYER